MIMSQIKELQIQDIEHLLLNQKFQRILYIRHFDPSYISLFGNPIYSQKRIIVFNHNTPGHKTICDDWGDEALIHHNHYMISFLDNLALIALSRNLLSFNDMDIYELFASLGRKFIAEQMFEIGDSRMARVLFLENMIAYDHRLRPIFRLRNTELQVNASSDLFTSISSDFLLHHELGHLYHDQKGFDHYQKLAKTYLDTLPEYNVIQDANEQIIIIEESASDIFALEAVLHTYSSKASTDVLFSYLRFFIASLVRMDMLYAQAIEYHKQNVDANIRNPCSTQNQLCWAMRELTLAYYSNAYINEIQANTNLPCTSKSYICIDDYSLLDSLAEVDYSEQISSETRILAEAISLGFENNTGFRAVIDSTRITRTVTRFT